MVKESSYVNLISRLSVSLKAHDFRKKGDAFFLSGAVWGTIWFRPDRKYKLPEGQTKFTAEVYLTSQDLLDVFAKNYYRFEPVVIPPKISHLSRRLGHFAGFTLDHWWTIEQKNEIDVIQEIMTAVERGAVPFLRSNMSEEAILSSWLTDFNAARGNLSIPELQGLCYLCHKLKRMKEFSDIRSFLESKYGQRTCDDQQTTVLDFLKRYDCKS